MPRLNMIQTERSILLVDDQRQDPLNPPIVFSPEYGPFAGDTVFFWNGTTMWEHHWVCGWSRVSYDLDEILSICKVVRGQWAKLPELLDKLTQYGAVFYFTPNRATPEELQALADTYSSDRSCATVHEKDG